MGHTTSPGGLSQPVSIDRFAMALVGGRGSMQFEPIQTKVEANSGRLEQVK